MGLKGGDLLHYDVETLLKTLLGGFVICEPDVIPDFHLHILDNLLVLLVVVVVGQNISETILDDLFQLLLELFELPLLLSLEDVMVLLVIVILF